MSTAKTRREQDADYWRGRYLRDLATLQTRVESLQETEDLLRRLLSRFCVSLSGRDEAMDEVILRLRRALRSSGQAQALRPLLAELGAVLEALDVGSGREALQQEQPNVPRLLVSLLDGIQFDGAFRAQARELARQLVDGEQTADTTGYVVAIAELVNLQSHSLQGALRKFETVFGRVNQRLSEMFEDVALDAEAFAAVQKNGRELEQQLLGEVTGLGDEVKQSVDLDQLQKQVDQRLRRIERHMDDFRAREQQQEAAYRGRAERMRKRIAELEAQTGALHQAMQRQQREALVDPLTGIANRTAYRQQGEAFLKRAQRNGTPLCLAVWDVDHFKLINDNFGHKAGDRALQLIGRQLAKSARASDFVARYGGEEFVMLLEGTPVAAAVQRLDRLRVEIAELPFHHQGRPVPLTISCGVTQVQAEHDLDTAFERADAALYESKRSGRNRISSA